MEIKAIFDFCLAELTTKVKPYDVKKPPKVMYHSYNALERRRKLFTIYAILESVKDVKRLRNSKHFKCGDVFKIHRISPPRKRKIKITDSREIRNEEGILVKIRLRDTDSVGREMIYSLGGWD